MHRNLSQTICTSPANKAGLFIMNKESKLIAGRKVLLSKESSVEDEKSSTWELMQLIEDLGKEAFLWIENRFGGYSKESLDLKMISTPDWGDNVQMECRFQLLDRKHGQLKINSYVQDGKRSKRRAQVIYLLKLGMT